MSYIVFLLAETVNTIFLLVPLRYVLKKMENAAFIRKYLRAALGRLCDLQLQSHGCKNISKAMFARSNGNFSLSTGISINPNFL